MALYLLFYQLFLSLYHTGVRIASTRNNKAKLWLKGRENWQKSLQENVREKFTEGLPVIWIHCASLGEFEQGRPVLEKIKQLYPQTNCIVSFFSPSGYEVRKNYATAQVICYLPIDGASNAKEFLDIVKPSLILWVKYEYWYYYLTEVKNRSIPLLLVSGIFRETQPFFQWYGKLHRKMLESFTVLFIQNTASAELAAGIVGGEKVQVTGDTRFDRVVEIAENFQSVAKIEEWLQGVEKVMVCGSTWDEDEKELSHYIRLHPEIKFMVAPHNIDGGEIEELQSLLPGATLFTKLVDGSAAKHGSVLIINTVGLLSRLYHYASITYVGGGFGAAGIHNVLEAAVWGKPVIHGPEYHKFSEAKELIAAGGSFETEDALHLEKLLDKLFSDQAFYEGAAQAAKEYVYSKKGATDAIVDYIQEKRLLTNS